MQRMASKSLNRPPVRGEETSSTVLRTFVLKIILWLRLIREKRLHSRGSSVSEVISNIGKTAKQNTTKYKNRRNNTLKKFLSKVVLNFSEKIASKKINSLGCKKQTILSYVKF